MQEICQSGSEGGAKRTFVPTPILLPTFQTEDLVLFLCLGEIFALAYIVTFFVWQPPRMM